jgi:hypothetical protein
MGIKKTLASIVLAGASVLGLNGGADADSINWQVVYQTDFSTDPEWTTNKPEQYYRVNDPSSPYHNTFHMTQIDRAETFAYKLIPELKGNVPIKIEYDTLLSNHSGSGNARFALSNGDMRLVPPIPLTSETIILDYGNVWANQTLGLYIYDQGPDVGPSIPMPLQEGWYHNEIVYYPGARAFRVKVNSPDGIIHDATSNPISGSFDALDRLIVGDIWDDNTGVGSSYIDNVVVSTPEPTTLGMLAFGGLGLATIGRKKK